MAAEQEKKPKVNTFASRAGDTQGDIISCQPKYRVSGSRRVFTELHEAVLVQDAPTIIKLCNEQPQLAKVKDKGGNMPIHIAAQRDTSSDICGYLIEAFPEALVIRNDAGRFPGDLAMANPDISRDCKNMMQDGRTEHKGNWVYDRYEKERHAHAVQYAEVKDKRNREADAVRHAVAGYVPPRNVELFLSAHESAR